MNAQIKKGLGFGLTSGVITTLGLIVGLDASTGSRLAVIAGIFVIAIADSLSDAMGIHMTEEAAHKTTQRQVWEATISTFLFKFIFALTFVVPFLFFSLVNSVVICIIWGLFLITVYSYHLAKNKKMAAYKVICEHLLLTVIVIGASYFVGKGVSILI